jgi:hypothetical protein
MFHSYQREKMEKLTPNLKIFFLFAIMFVIAC